MTTVDWVIVAFVALLAIYGYLQGFVVGALSLAGFVIGAFLGTPPGRPAGAGGDHSRYAPLFGLLGALLAGGVLATGLEGIGLRARSALRFPGLRTVDGVLGAALTACVGLGDRLDPGGGGAPIHGFELAATDIQRSAILRQLNQFLPPSGAILNALARFDPLPSIRGPSADVPPPSPGIVGASGVRMASRGAWSGSWHRLWPRRGGQRLGGRPADRRDQRPVVAGESDTTVPGRGQPAGAVGRGRRLRPAR